MAKDIMVVATITSLEVAKMMEKDHKNLMQDIRKYSKYIKEANDSLGAVKNDATSLDGKSNELKIQPIKDNERKNARIEDGFIDLDEFWKESTYIDQRNREKICYNITKKGCEFIAHKCTGKKGVVFTARYINKFHKLEEKANNGTTALLSKNPAPLTTTFYHKNLYRIEIFCKAMGMTKKQFIHNFIITIGEKYDINKATAQYVLENGQKPRFILEILDYFPEMGETAQNFFDKIYNEYVKEKKEDGSKEA